MIESAESVGWGPIVTLGLSLATALLGVGASTARNKRTAQDLDELKKEHATQIAEVRARNDTLNAAFNAYQLQVEREYPRKADLVAMETRLVQKVEEIKVDIGKRGIEHTIKNAVAAAMAGHVIAAKSGRPG